MKRETRYALFVSVLWTFAAAAFCFQLLTKGLKFATVVLTIISILAAVVWWKTFAQRRQEDDKDE